MSFCRDIHQGRAYKLYCISAHYCLTSSRRIVMSTIMDQDEIGALALELAKDVITPEN